MRLPPSLLGWLGPAWAIWSIAAAIVGLACSVALAQDLPKLGPLDTAGRVPYFIGEGMPGSGYKAGDGDLARWALATWQRAVDGRIRFEAASEDDALVRVYWVPAGAGQYGEMKSFRLGERRGAAVFIRPDTSGLGPAIAATARADALFRDAVVYLTCLHELGHAVGLAHTADIRDIMYSFGFGGDIPNFFQRYRNQLRARDDMARVAGLSDSDVARARRLYPVR